MSVALFGRLAHALAGAADAAPLPPTLIASAWPNMVTTMNARAARTLTAVGLLSRTLMR